MSAPEKATVIFQKRFLKMNLRAISQSTMQLLVSHASLTCPINSRAGRMPHFSMLFEKVVIILS